MVNSGEGSNSNQKKLSNHQMVIHSVRKVEQASVPLIKIRVNQTDIDLLLCAKSRRAKVLSDTSFLISKKSEISILGLECTNLLRQIASDLNPRTTKRDQASQGSMPSPSD